MKELIKTYEDEIYLGKKSMDNFALKDAVAYNVASAKVETYQRIVEDLKRLPEPHTVRPMSELPLNDERCIFLLKYRVEGQEWKTGTFKNGIKQPYVDLDDRYWHYYEDNYRCDATGKTIIGWLPLPNPNDIKL